MPLKEESSETSVTPPEDVWDEWKFWGGSITEPYAAPAVGYSRVLDCEITSERARADARKLRLVKSSMELTLARIEEFGLEKLPKYDTFFDTLLQGKLSEDRIPEMEARQAICQRHISLFEMQKCDTFFYGYGVCIEFNWQAREIRNYLAHSYGHHSYSSQLLITQGTNCVCKDSTKLSASVGWGQRGLRSVRGISWRCKPVVRLTPTEYGVYLWKRIP
jgi:hypothetical protein